MLVWRSLSAPRSTVHVLTKPDAAPETTWNGQESYVVDPVAGLRVRRSSTFQMPMVALDNSDVQQVVKRRDAHGFLRNGELPASTSRPAVLVIGDSHVDGVVSTEDNFTTLLEQASERSATPFYCLNAGCGYYSLWQHVLRACDLMPQYRPRVVVLVVFLGNDFLDLDNPTVPHLDDQLRERPAGERSSPETTSARLAEFALPEPYGQLFWQGLNQALLVHRQPERLAVWMRKAEHAISTMARAAAGHGSDVVWALLPSFDLVFPDQARSLGKLADEVGTALVQRRIRDQFVRLLQANHARAVDFEPAFRAEGKTHLYAIDFHVYRAGHRLMAEVLQPVLAELLAR